MALDDNVGGRSYSDGFIDTDTVKTWSKTPPKSDDNELINGQATGFPGLGDDSWLGYQGLP